MPNPSATTGLHLRSTVKREGDLALSLATVPTPEPRPEEVIVRIDASPINPSDQGLLFGGADMSTAKLSGNRERFKMAILFHLGGLDLYPTPHTARA